MSLIDLRSDTITLPTPAMWRAISVAPLGDDSLDRDPTVLKLEQLSARMLGKEAALFVASGTMGNLVAALTHGRGRGTALVDEHAHIDTSESDGISRVAGLVCRKIPSRGGEMELLIVEQLLSQSNWLPNPPVSLAVVESSHNHSGGTVPSLLYMRTLYKLASKACVPVHLDGARMFNAAVALGVDVAEVARWADSVTFCLSKGLSAPMGAILSGTSEFIVQARLYRRMLGGGLRQGGIVAAAGIEALESMPARLAEDHVSAHALWRELHNVAPQLVSPTPPQTNMVLVSLGAAPGKYSAPEWLTALQDLGVRARLRDDATVRLVTHRHITSALAVEAAQRILKVAAQSVLR